MKGGCIYGIGGREYWLVCTADAYFDITGIYGGEFGEKLLAGGRDGFECALGCLCILAREGELCRRYMGYGAEDFLKEDELRRVILPGDIGKVVSAVLDAVQAGLRIDKGESEEKSEPVDIGLREFEKKTAICRKR